MRGPLQYFDFRRSQYQRPNEEWRCGRTAIGRPCHIGPDGKGRCQADFECQPLNKDSRWLCARSELAGGQCSLGPMPDGTCCRPVPRCVPIRNWRSRISATSQWFVILTIGIVLLVSGGSYLPAFVNPGKLTFQHSRVGSCDSCHSVFDNGPITWFHTAFSKSYEVEDSKRCMACHSLGANSFDPHGMPKAELAAVRERAGAATSSTRPWALRLSRTVMAPRHESKGALPCGTCHQEHEGRSADLTRVPDQRCMTCHTAIFGSLIDGHPAFTNFPFERRTRIAFDHARHFQTHFHEAAMKEHTPKGCTGCHAPDARGSTMVIKGFEAACNACHGGQITGVGRATAKGIEFLGVPGLDVISLMDLEAAIGTWPEDADGEITPFMTLLLSTAPGFTEARAMLADLDLMDLADAPDEQVAAIETYAWSVKNLFFDLTVRGVPALQERLEDALGRELSSAELSSLSGLLPMDAINTAQIDWFPGLSVEIQRHMDGETVEIPDPAEEDQEPQQDEAAESSDSGDGDLAGDGDLSGEGDLTGDGDLAADGELDKDDGDLSGDGELDKEGDLAADEGEAPDATDSEEEPVDMADGEEWSVAGGWYRDAFVLFYRPRGHADTFLSAWLDVSGSAIQNPDAARRVFEPLADPKAPGRCAKCHTIDAGAPGSSLSVNWMGKRPVAHAQNFTAFSHTAHFSLLDAEGCTLCHGLNPAADTQAGFKDRNPLTFASNFKHIQRGTCAACHTEVEASDSCVGCHNYHIGDLPPPAVSAPKIMTQRASN